LIAAAGDRHLAEFAPLSWYLKDPETVKAPDYGGFPVGLDDARELFTTMPANTRKYLPGWRF
jgi:hypothetical protein